MPKSEYIPSLKLCSQFAQDVLIFYLTPVHWGGGSSGSIRRRGCWFGIHSHLSGAHIACYTDERRCERGQECAYPTGFMGVSHRTFNSIPRSRVRVSA